MYGGASQAHIRSTAQERQAHCGGGRTHAGTRSEPAALREVCRQHVQAAAAAPSRHEHAEDSVTCLANLRPGLYGGEFHGEQVLEVLVNACLELRVFLKKLGGFFLLTDTICVGQAGLLRSGHYRVFFNISLGLQLFRHAKDRESSRSFA